MRGGREIAKVGGWSIRLGASGEKDKHEHVRCMDWGSLWWEIFIWSFCFVAVGAEGFDGSHNQKEWLASMELDSPATASLGL